MEQSLDAYRRKRDPARTPEPFGGSRRVVSAPPNGACRFVVQQHSARRMHWDFRLEIDGVLKSWAVPRGPSVDPKEKRLAVQTEDHPIEYADFEGIIPAGNYGAGAVIVWDRGIYALLDDVSAADALGRGKLDLDLRGFKLHGRWALVRIKGGKGNEWLLMKKPEGRTTAEPVVSQPASVFSGLTVDELREHVSRSAELAALAEAAGAPRRAVTLPILPMSATTADAPFSRPGWLFELKYDGVRVLLQRAPDGRVRLFSRNRRDVTASFPEIARAAAQLPCDAFVIDGEVAAVDEHGVSSFELLQQRLGQTDPGTVRRAQLEVPIVLYCFDLLAAASHDLRGLPLRTRKDLLARLVPRVGVLSLADHVEQHGADLFRAAMAAGAEGIIGKDAESAYETGRRSHSWVKFKRARSADLAVVGYVPGKGARHDIGALMLAWRAGSGLIYAGNVGSGLSPGVIDTLLPRLRGATRPTPAFAPKTAVLPRNAVFVSPEIVVEVRYNEVLSSGLLRQPVFVQIRADKGAAEADARPAARPVDEVPTPSSPAAPALQPSNLDKVFWPEDGYTKGDLLKYYETVWPHLAPYLHDRPVVMTRYPDGIGGKSFFQTNAPEFAPEWVSTHRIRDTDYFVCNDLQTLLYIINLGCIPLHIWSARSHLLDRPDWAILDLDPKGAPFSHVIRVAKHIHAVLAPLDLPHFVKTSGQDGLHVLVALGGSLTHDEARTFAEVLARLVVERCAAIATIARPLGDRGGKVYVDYLQNGFGKTLVAPFSVRPRRGAPVSAPLDWREVGPRLDPGRFTIRTLPARLKRGATPWRGLLDAPIDLHAALAALARLA